MEDTKLYTEALKYYNMSDTEKNLKMKEKEKLIIKKLKRIKFIYSLFIYMIFAFLCLGAVLSPKIDNYHNNHSYEISDRLLY